MVTGTALLCGCLPVFDEICLRCVNFVCSCITHRSNLVKFIARYSIFYERFRSPAGRNMLYCAQRYSCAVEDLLFTLSARNAVSSRVRERLSDEQIQTASLLQECIMVRDGLARLPDVFTAGDMSDIIRYLPVYVLIVLSFCLSFYFSLFYIFVCTLCTTHIINNKNKWLLQAVIRSDMAYQIASFLTTLCDLPAYYFTYCKPF